MLEQRRQTGFAKEAENQRSAIALIDFADELQRAATTTADFLRLEHRAHPAFSEEAQQPVPLR